MAQRERINRVKIEKWRVSRIPIDPTETVFQGDAMAWNDATKLATKLTAAASGAQFMGLSETTNPMETAGSTRFLTDPTEPRINVITEGLVELVAGEAMTAYPRDLVTLGADSQTVVKTGANSTNALGYIDPAYTAAGTSIALGALVRFWLRPTVRFGP